jgi:hypothetical protein
MATEDPQIPELAERRVGRNVGYHICRIILGLG